MPGLFDPNVDKYVLDKAGEYMVLEVRKHWVASLWPAVRLVGGLLIFISGWAFPVPAFFDYAETKTALWRERSVRQLVALQQRCDILLFSVGALAAEVPSQIHSATIGG